MRASSKRWALLAVLAALIFVAFVRLRLAGVPLERDEGEYAYAGRLILEGIPPYELAYNMKFPGTYYAYALILALFGRSPSGIHAGLLVVNAATIVLVFAVGRRLMGAFAGSAAAASFAILSLDRSVLGVFAHATHFVVLTAMAGLYALLLAIERERPWKFVVSGALFGLSILMKQHAIFFLPLGVAIICAAGRSGPTRDARSTARRIGAWTLGAALPLAIILVLLSLQGALGRFWFWTIRYAAAYVNEVPVLRAWSSLVDGVVAVTRASPSLWLLAALGLPALWFGRREPHARLVVFGWLVASFLAICPGFYFRNHYFILVLPAIAFLSAAAVAGLRSSLERLVSPTIALVLSAAVLALALGHFVERERDYLFTMSPRALIRAAYGRLPFIEAEEIGRYIRERAGEGDRIAVLGSEPEIYFYADRKSATGYIYTYPLIEPQPYADAMQAEMIREIESSHPAYLVFSKVEGSWSMRRESNQGIVQWAFRYVRQCYDPVGVADIVSDETTRFIWGDDVLTYKPASPDVVYTFKRRGAAPCSAGP